MLGTLKTSFISFLGLNENSEENFTNPDLATSLQTSMGLPPTGYPNNFEMTLSGNQT